MEWPNFKKLFICFSACITSYVSAEIIITNDKIKLSMFRGHVKTDVEWNNTVQNCLQGTPVVPEKSVRYIELSR